jgi:two-component system, LytTR family, sensor kinase
MTVVHGDPPAPVGPAAGAGRARESAARRTEDVWWLSPRPWAVAFLVFSAIGLSHAVQMYSGMLARAPHLASWSHALAGTLPFWYSKLILLPLVIVAGDSWRVTDRPLTRVPLHLVLSLVFAAVQLTLGMATAWWILPPPAAGPFADSLARLFSTYFVTGAVFYWVFLGVFHAIDYAQQLAVQRLQSRVLQAQLSEARLQALRSQLNPHFLFNALNAVGAMCDRGDTAAASQMVGRIGSLLRTALAPHDQMTTLDDELQFVDTYLHIEQARIGPRLTVDRVIDETVRSAAVPSLLLQPLVENAVRHGAGRQPGPARIRLTASARAGDRLVLRIEDNGPGFYYPPPSSKADGGVGLRNSVGRLQQLYGDAAYFDVRPSELGGACVEILIPAGRVGGKE